jgi:uncharacterized membrane protein YoaT (DUF817 family)
LITSLLKYLDKKTNETVVIAFVKEMMAFGLKELLACLFPAFIFFMLFISKTITIPYFPRYDFLLIACLLMQWLMYKFKLESGQELLVITMFHLLGISLEIFKVYKGSWSYGEMAYSKIFDVPLFSGFMYASVGSYVCQAWRWFDLKVLHWPKAWQAFLISILIYLNFFTHHYIFDFRWVITLLLIVVFWKTKVLFTTNNQVRKMPLVISFLLIGFFIWVAENLATYLGAWKYASQHDGWKMVDIGKISSWFLLIVLSIVIVTQLKLVKYGRA